jgi:hypothetical protein
MYDSSKAGLQCSLYPTYPLSLPIAQLFTLELISSLGQTYHCHACIFCRFYAHKEARKC